MSTSIKLSDKLSDLIISAIVQPKLEWDYRENLSLADAYQAIATNESREEFEENIRRLNEENSYLLEAQSIKNAIEEHIDEINLELGRVDDPATAQEVFDNYYTDFQEHVYTDFNIEELLGNAKVTIRFELLSNYDCINSHWLEAQGGEENGYQDYECYFNDVMWALGIQPADILPQLNGKEYVPNGRVTGPALVDVETFLNNEIMERGTPACLLTVLATVNAADMYKNNQLMSNDQIRINDGLATFTIPKGNPVGFYSEFQGGGSMFSTMLEEPLTITAGKALPWDVHCTWAIRVDNPKNNYHLQSCFGSDADMFGEDATFVTVNQLADYEN